MGGWRKEIAEWRMKGIRQKAKVPSSEYRVASSEGRIPSSEYRVASSEGRIPSSEFRVASCEYRVPSTELRVPRAKSVKINIAKQSMSSVVIKAFSI
jgi:hypothetical protein